MFFCRIFVVSHYRKASLGNAFMLCFRKIPFEKILLDKLGRGLGKREYHDFLSIFLSRGTKKLRSGNPLCFRNFLVSKKFMD